MAKQGSDPKAATLARIRRTEAYAEKVRLLFAKTVNDILALNKTMPSLDEGVMFSFDGESVKKQKEVEVLLRRLHSAVTMAIQQGVKLEWDAANQECDKLVQSVFGKKVLENPEFSAWMGRNTAARDAFLSRSEHGLNLSDRVWKSVRQLRDEMEVAMTVSIGEGESSSSMSRKVRQYLNNPDDMFRRFRYKKGEKDIIDPETGEITGKEIVYGKKWKKRIKDEVTGKYKWIDYDRDSYKTGAGVYKSSARNAMRVARTETNIAYRRADNARWQDMDFVLGQRVQLSKNHPKKDICDKLQGDYPKDFVFDGWHPQCFCFCTPILMDESEMAKVTEAFLKGEKYTPRGKQITDYPAAFKDWVREHSEDIAASRERGTEPYFIRNNAQAIDEIINPQPKELSILEKAKLRHEARTPEQEEAIKNAWEERKHKHQLIKKTADNVLNVAQDYGEIDYSELQSAIKSGDLTKMQTITKTVAQHVSAMKKQEAAISDLIPDAHEWHKTISMKELIQTYSAVESKLAQWSSLSLEQQAKKLKFEAVDFLGGNMKDVQSKFPKTWKVSQAAYLKKLDEVNLKIEIKAVQDQLDIVKAWSATHPKSLNVANLLSEAQASLNAGEDIALIKQKAQLAINEHQKRLAEQARRDAKKAAKGTSFDADAYTKKRKDAALWAKDTKDADKVLRDKCGDVWVSASDDEKDAIHGYTSSYHNIQEPLRGLTYYGSDAQRKLGEKRIPLIESIINKSSYDFDMWLQRGDDMVALKKFGLSNYNSASDAEIYALVGREGTEGAFWSAGVAKGKGFSGQIIFNIYAPRGTKAMYCEPFSAFGHGDGRHWDGRNKQSSFGYESEILIQRGTKFRITKVQKSGGVWYIDVDIIEQKPLPFPYVGGYPYL